MVNDRGPFTGVDPMPLTAGAGKGLRPSLAEAGPAVAEAIFFGRFIERFGLTLIEAQRGWPSNGHPGLAPVA